MGAGEQQLDKVKSHRAPTSQLNWDEQSDANDDVYEALDLALQQQEEILTSKVRMRRGRAG